MPFRLPIIAILLSLIAPLCCAQEVYDDPEGRFSFTPPPGWMPYGQEQVQILNEFIEKRDLNPSYTFIAGFSPTGESGGFPYILVQQMTGDMNEVSFQELAEAIGDGFSGPLVRKQLDKWEDLLESMDERRFSYDPEVQSYSMMSIINTADDRHVRMISTGKVSSVAVIQVNAYSLIEDFPLLTKMITQSLDSLFISPTYKHSPSPAHTDTSVGHPAERRRMTREIRLFVSLCFAVVLLAVLRATRRKTRVV